MSVFGSQNIFSLMLSFCFLCLKVHHQPAQGAGAETQWCYPSCGCDTEITVLHALS